MSDSQRHACETTVKYAARRVRAGGEDVATVHPIVEGNIAVCRAIATDSHATLTVSVRDPTDDDDLFYSVPCVVGRAGVIDRCTPELSEDDGTKLGSCLDVLRRRVAEGDKVDRS